MAPPDPLPAWTHGLVADAAIFPPGNAPLDRAVAEHRQHLAAEYAPMLASFVVSDVRLPELLDVLDETSLPVETSPVVEPVETPLDLTVVVTGGVGAIEPAVRWATRAGSVSLRAVEFALRDEDDPVHNARRVGAMLDELAGELEDVTVYVEPPRPGPDPMAGWWGALDELALRELPLKFRTGGVTPDAFPGDDELLTCIDAALDRELAFKCTAGLHHAVRHTDPETGIEHHGFLNVLLATRALLDGGDAHAVLAETSAETIAAASDPEVLDRTRRWFRGFGSCSILEPHDDLVELGLVETSPA